MAHEQFIYDVLHVRDGETIIYQCMEVALTFAILGRIAYSVEIINLAAQLGVVRLSSLRENGLYFAWDSADLWPDIVPTDHKTAEYLIETDEDGASPTKWATRDFGHQAEAPHEKMEFDEASVARLLLFIEEHKPDESFLFSDNDIPYKLLSPRAVIKALDWSLRLGAHDNDVDYLFTKIYHFSEISDDVPLLSFRQHNGYILEIGRLRRVWPLLKDGRIGKRLSKEQDIDAQFKKAKEALTTRIEKGISVLSHHSMGELLEKLNANTIRHDSDGDVDIYQLQELQAQTFMGNRSILHPPATIDEVRDLEKRLGVELPEDYKDLLRHSNGLEDVWNGYYRQSSFGSSHEVAWGEDIWGGDGPELNLISWETLPFKFDSPKLDLTQAININVPDGVERTWLVKPELTKKAVAAVLKRFETLNDEEKELTRNVFAAHFGSFKAIKDLEWCVVEYNHADHFPVFKTVRDFVEELVRNSG